MPIILGFLRAFFPTLFRRAGLFLAGFVGSALPTVVQFVATAFKKIGLLALIVVAIGLAIEGLSSAIGIIAEMVIEESAPWMLEVGRMFIPDNLSFCITLLVLARLKSLIFMWVTRLSEKLIHT
ncbi:hypothetical protein SA496_21375 [Pseudomonas sp. JS3066]|uniref:hypothetical protein n=1 Tax=Pseudomonas sp. JS3066 TaxID=3090665 RepID=UPI002E7C3649|nr:hypothetical protein [Pseudomonas sp. JS3066]WVK92253.1 hypothetical protein SA496_21375 [Pseudomonas sp. JS3066]